MKTIGVIGGLGPQATMDFEARVHTVSQRLIPRAANSGYPPMVVYYHRYPPFIVDEHFKPILPLQPEPHLVEMLGKLGQMVDFIVITANAPHLHRDMIEETTGLKVLSMIDVTLEDVQRRGWQRVGVVGLGDPKVYTTQLDALSIPYETLSPESGGLRDRLDQGIIALMEGRSGREERNVSVQAIESLRARGVEGIILGCTEIPLLLGAAAEADDLVNPLQLLAEAAVRFAIE